MNYLPVRLSTLKPQVILDFKIYVQLPHKYVLYVREGGDLEAESIKRFKKKKVKKLFIEEQDEQKYQAFLDARLTQALEDPSGDLTEKVGAAVGVAASASDRVYERPGERSSYDAAKKASSGLLKLMREKEEALSAILSRSHGEDVDPVEKIRAHAVNSCSLALKFGEFFGMKDNELEELGISALYHDIGFSKAGEEVQNCFFLEMDDIDAKLLGDYKEHPRKGVELLQDKSFASPNVLDLILTHEERLGAKGFPSSLNKLTPIQEVHALCCHYDREVTCLGKDPKAVVENFMVAEIGAFNLDTLKKFKEFIVKLGT